MSKVKLYNLKGEATGDIELDKAVFEVEVDPALVQFVMNAQRANAHVPYAHTKGRAEVRGGGRKPWRQKGTGRARHGSSRSPIWRGGGVTFGPTSARNMSKKINKKERRNAIRMVLSDKANESAIFVIDSLKEVSGKTKELSTLITALPTEKQSVLFAVADKNESLTRAAQNLEAVNSVLADSVNVLDLLKYRYLIIDKAGLEELTTQLK